MAQRNKGVAEVELYQSQSKQKGVSEDDDRTEDYQKQSGLLEPSKQLANVSRACNILGYSRDSFYRYKELYETGDEVALQQLQ